MNWVDQMNDVMGYIERNLTETIDMDEVGRIAACPSAVFQRIFMLSANLTLTEYIRRRRLSRAASDLVGTRERVVDIAMRYGYDTSDAFCVAFKRLYGVTPSDARRKHLKLRGHYRLHFTLSATYIKGDEEMVIQNVDRYRVMEPLFEGARVILNHLGEGYTPAYIQGVSGAAFRMSGGCPSRPTCFYTRWPSDFLRYLGYEVTEVPCKSPDGNDLTAAMIDAVKAQIDKGRPALVWHAVTSMEWDVVCGYDEEQRQFIGRGSYKGLGDYEREHWDRPGSAEIAFGAILIGEKKYTPNAAKLESDALSDAVKFARRVTDSPMPHEREGIQFYRWWAEAYLSDTKERDAADAYCHEVYTSSRSAGVDFLREIAPAHPDREASLLKAADSFAREVDALECARPYLSWHSPWGVDAARNRAVAPLIAEAAQWYEAGIACLEKG